MLEDVYDDVLQILDGTDNVVEFITGDILFVTENDLFVYELDSQVMV